MQSVNTTHYNTLPFGYFLLNKKLEILGLSNYSMENFPAAGHFLDFVDSCSRKKAVQFILETPSICSIELSLQTNEAALTLHEVYCYHEKDVIHIFCLTKEGQTNQVKEWMEQISQKMSGLQPEAASAALQNDSDPQIFEMATFEKRASGIKEEIHEALTTVKGFIQLIKPHLHHSGKEPYADAALSEIERADSRIHEILLFTSPPDAVKKTALLSKVIKETVQQLKEELKLKDNQLIMKEHVEDILFHIDTQQIKRMLINLIRNAFDAIHETEKNGGKVLIHFRKIGEFVHIFIEDNGCGIPTDDLTHIFTPFFSSKGNRSGLGLNVSQKIAAAHGGNLEVIKSSDKGTVFRAVLPI